MANASRNLTNLLRNNPGSEKWYQKAMTPVKWKKIEFRPPVDKLVGVRLILKKHVKNIERIAIAFRIIGFQIEDYSNRPCFFQTVI